MTEDQNPNDKTEDQAPHAKPSDYTDPRYQPTDAELKKFGPIERLSFFLNSTIKELGDILEKTPYHNLGNSSEIERYKDATGYATDMGWKDGQFENFQKRPGSKWTQVVEADGERLAIAKPGLSIGSDNKLSGDTAQFLAREALGKGSMVQVPLWRSGIWVTIKTPKLIDLIELDRRIDNVKIDLGRELYGNIFSNEMVYTVGILFDFVLDHIYISTLKSRRKDDMRQLILATDLMQLMNGLSISIYPKGYPLDQPCVANVEKCQHIDSGMVNLVKLSWTDRSALSDEQLRHMANREARYTVDEVKDYQKKHQQGFSTSRDLTDNFRIIFKEPSMDRYLRAGFEWVESIVQSCERVFDQEANTQQRNHYINGQATRSAMRRWSHWVDKFVIGDKEITEPSTIGQIISDSISPDDEYREIMTEAVREMIDASTITVIGIPKYKCPSCGEEPETHPIYPQLMAINPVRTFLHQLGQRLITLIEEKSTQS